MGCFNVIPCLDEHLFLAVCIHFEYLDPLDNIKSFMSSEVELVVQLRFPK